MKAIVKNIRVGTKRKWGKDKNTFIPEMIKYIGTEIEVEKSDYDSQWFKDTNDFWSYHKDWLEFVEENHD